MPPLASPDAHPETRPSGGVGAPHLAVSSPGAWWSSTRARPWPGRAASVLALALSTVATTACDPCVDTVEADTGISSERPVRLEARWCILDEDCIIVETLDSNAPSPSPTRFQLSDRNGHWFVELLDPSVPDEEAHVVLTIRDIDTHTLVVRAQTDWEAQSETGCVFLSVTAPERP